MQLTTEFNPILSLPPSAPSTQAAKQLLLQIADHENTYQTTLSETYQDLGEKRFKTLRRALPMTRNKIDWDKVSSSHPHTSLDMLFIFRRAGYRV